MKDRSKLSQYILLPALFLALVFGTFFAVKLPTRTNEPATPIPTLTNTELATSQPLSITTIDASATTTNNIETANATPTISAPSICARIWGMDIPETLPTWLTTPDNVNDLYTEIKYVYLAGDLIKNGFVDASDCPDGGVTINGASNTCGMEKALSAVVYWQNQFDQEILNAAQQNQIPAELIKRLFAQETQFWPPTNLAPIAYGIGNVTSPGIEPLFLWYDDVYQETCLDLFSAQCSQPYSALNLSDQQNLRGYFISQHIHAYCETCSNNIDIEKTKSSIDYFAKLIVANCYQVDLILKNSGFLPEEITYEDTWKLTLANYTVGAGCVINGLNNIDRSTAFSWDSFSETIDQDCSRANLYINNITR